MRILPQDLNGALGTVVAVGSLANASSSLQPMSFVPKVFNPSGTRIN